MPPIGRHFLQEEFMFSTDFIAATKELSTYTDHVAAPYLRRVFSVERGLESATVTICGLGFYRLFINGTEITKGLLAPYLSNPDDLLYYDCYDIAGLLTEEKMLSASCWGTASSMHPAVGSGILIKRLIAAHPRWRWRWSWNMRARKRSLPPLLLPISGCAIAWSAASPRSRQQRSS